MKPEKIWHPKYAEVDQTVIVGQRDWWTNMNFCAESRPIFVIANRYIGDRGVGVQKTNISIEMKATFSDNWSIINADHSQVGYYVYFGVLGVGGVKGCFHNVLNLFGQLCSFTLKEMLGWSIEGPSKNQCMSKLQNPKSFADDDDDVWWQPELDQDCCNWGCLWEGEEEGGRSLQGSGRESYH